MSAPSLAWKAFDFMLTGLREDLGQPVRLRRLLAAPSSLAVSLPAPPLSVAAGSIVQWHEWGPRDGALIGWRALGGHYGSFRVQRSEFRHFGRRQALQDWSCDIQEVAGLLASKSDLRRFADLDALVEANSPEMIAELSPEGLRRNLAHGEIRILNRPSSGDFFARYAWDGRVFLMNSGGSHHFAAARYIAARLGCAVPLTGLLRTYSVDPLAVAGLRHSFDLFAIPESAVSAFHRAMESYRAAYCSLPLPAPYAEARAVLLPKDEGRSRRAAGVLREAGALDLGVSLADLVSRQSRFV